jgi:hypothetical protein
MNGLRPLLEQPIDAERHLHALALAIHRAAVEGHPKITLNDLASSTQLPIEDVFATVGLLERRGLIKVLQRSDGRLAPVDWLQATRSEQLRLMGMNAVEMTPFLPPLLEGKLEYSPAADDAVVAAVADSIDPQEFPHPDELHARIRLPAYRARAAVARYLRGPRDAGMRLRVTVDVTFPEMTTENSTELAERLIDAIARNTSVRCEDVRLRSLESRSRIE